MTLEQAQRLTTKNIIIATSALLLFFTLLLLMGETNGDFANGILFFLADLINPIVIIYLLILYSLTYFFSRRATNDIIVKGKTPWQTSLLISALISLVTVVYLNVWALIRMNETSLANPSLKYAVKLFFSTFFFEFIIWSVVTAKTKKLKIDVN